jgi:hypothetical protein
VSLLQLPSPHIKTEESFGRGGVIDDVLLTARDEDEDSGQQFGGGFTGADRRTASRYTA